MPSSDSLPDHSLTSKRLAEPYHSPVNQTVTTRSVPESTKPSPVDESPKLTGATWVTVYEQLQAAIKVRHYSNKTWQAYRYWL